MLKITEANIDTSSEEELWEKFWLHPEDEELRLQLVELYLPMVVRISNKLAIRIQYKADAEELLGAGVLGLHDAISNFSKNQHATFSTYAYKRVKGSILDELRSQDHLTRTQRKNYRTICKAIETLTERLLRPPKDQEISLETGIPTDEIATYIGMGSTAVSLNEEKSADGMKFLDFLADEKITSPIEAADLSISIERLNNIFHLLNERDQQLIYLRHYEELSVKEIALVFEISEGRISQLYKQILLKLRAMMKAENIQ